MTPSPPLPPTMLAWTFNTSGPPTQILKLHRTHPVPSPPKGNNLLLRISSVSLSSVGTNLMHDVPSLLRKNAIPELDFAGPVVLAGPSAPSEFQVGTLVFGTVPPSATVLSGAGALAEFVVVPAESVAVKPDGVRLVEAAGLGSLGQTALKMVERAGVKAGDCVLIHGGSGGIIAIQAAKALGAVVVVTCSGGAAELVREVGADEVVDYTINEPLHRYFKNHYRSRPFDNILDTVGSQTLYSNSPGYLKPDGIYVNAGTMEDSGQLQTFHRWSWNSLLPTFLGGVPRKFVMFSAAISKDGVQQLAKLAGDGHLKVPIDSMFRMEDALKAYERLGSRMARGKVMVEITGVDEGSLTE